MADCRLKSRQLWKRELTQPKVGCSNERRRLKKRGTSPNLTKGSSSSILWLDLVHEGTAESVPAGYVQRVISRVCEMMVTMLLRFSPRITEFHLVPRSWVSKCDLGALPCVCGLRKHCSWLSHGITVLFALEWWWVEAASASSGESKELWPVGWSLHPSTHWSWRDRPTASSIRCHFRDWDWREDGRGAFGSWVLPHSTWLGTGAWCHMFSPKVFFPHWEVDHVHPGVNESTCIQAVFEGTGRVWRPKNHQTGSLWKEYVSPPKKSGILNCCIYWDAPPP